MNKPKFNPTPEGTILADKKPKALGSDSDKSALAVPSKDATIHVVMKEASLESMPSVHAIGVAVDRAQATGSGGIGCALAENPSESAPSLALVLLSLLGTGLLGLPRIKPAWARLRRRRK